MKKLKWIISTTSLIGASALISACTSFVESNFGDDNKNLEKIKEEVAKINLLDFVDKEVLKEAQKDYASNAINYKIFDEKKLVEKTDEISKNFIISIDFKSKGTSDEEGIFVPMLRIRHPLIIERIEPKFYEISGFKKKEPNYLENKYFNEVSSRREDTFTTFSALQNIGLMFVNDDGSTKDFKSFNGTLIDFKIEDNQPYPLTWYILTTATAANNNKNKNNFEDYKVNDDNNISSSLYLYNYISSEVLKENKSIYDLTQNKILNNNLVKNVSMISDPKTIFVGNNIMSTKPENSNEEEILNASVLEITFENEEVAKKLTNNLYSFIKNKDYPFKLINFFKSDIALAEDSTSGDFAIQVNNFNENISMAYDLEDLDFNSTDSIEEQIKAKLKFRMSLEDKSEHSLSSIKYNYNQKENDYLRDFYSVLLNQEDYISFNNQNYKPYGVASRFKNSYVTNNSFGSTLVSPIDINYRLGINYKNDQNSNANILYLSSDYFSKHQHLLELGGYDIFNYNIGTDKNKYTNQTKSYYSELKRLYNNNIKTLGTSLNDLKNNDK